MLLNYEENPDNIDIVLKDFIYNIMRYAWSNKENKSYLETIYNKTDIKLENIEKLVQHLLDEHDIKDILALLYTSAPNDVPEICYKIGDIDITFSKRTNI